MAKYDYMKLAKKDKLSEKELNALKNYINNGERGKMVLNEFWNNIDSTGDMVELTLDQQKKGAKYLYNLGFTPKGAERKNSPYGMREEYIVKNIDSIYLQGFHNAGSFFSSFYVPIYSAIGKDGSSMEYYVAGGKINIIG